MAEYIEREKLIEDVKNDCCELVYYTKADAIDCIKSAHAADVAPVVHGRWIYDCDATDWGIGGYICSRCKIKNNNLPCNRFKTVSAFSGAKFCPNCGAKMDLGD